MPTFRVLHISDLHIARVAESINFADARDVRGSVRLIAQRLTKHAPPHFRFRYPTTHDPLALDRIAQHAFYNTDLDLILITGDIATTGEHDDLSAAQRFVSAPATAGWISNDIPTLAAAGIPIALLPGNHDRYDDATFPFGASSTTFDTAFTEYWHVGQNVMPLAIMEKENEWLAIIGVDCSLRKPQPNPVTNAGEGECYPHLIKTLRLHTQRIRADLAKRGATPAIIWAIHFAPFFPRPKFGLTLNNEAAFIAAASEEGATYVLCGHTHDKADYTVGDITICCAGTASAYRAEHGHYIHTRAITVMNGTITGVQTTDHAIRY